MKKTLLFLSSILLTLTLTTGLTLSASAKNSVQSGMWNTLTWELNEATGKLVISGNGKMVALTDSSAWLVHSDKIQTVIIEEGVTSIGNYAFKNCQNLSSVTIPNSITAIGYLSFWNCNKLTRITIPNSCTDINQDAFTGCENIAEATIPGNAINALPKNGLRHLTLTNGTSIEEGAFQDKTGLVSISLPDSVTEIKSFAFYNCLNLTSILLPDSVTHIGNQAFQNCQSLESINLPNSITVLGDQVFSGCKKLSSVFLPQGLTSIGSSMFEHCESLSSVSVPPSIKSIGSRAFYGCDSLNELVLPAGVTTVGDFAFADCVGLKKIVIPNGIQTVSGYAFDTSNKIETAVLPISAISCVPKSNLKTVIFTSGTSLPDQALSECPLLEKIIFCGSESEWESLQKAQTRLDKLKNAEFSYHQCQWEITDAVHTGVCTACGSSVEGSHVYGPWSVITSPTEESEGKQQKSCPCGQNVSEPIPVLTHEYTANVIVPTCTDRGYTVHTCKNCADSYKDTYTDALEHSYDNDLDPSCNTCEEIREIASIQPLEKPNKSDQKPANITVVIGFILIFLLTGIAASISYKKKKR